jgi:hypothetical protein
MAYEQKDMSGTLFKNDRREKDSHPHATGTALVDGVEYWVSAWTKGGSKGKFQSLSFKRKEPRQQHESKPRYAEPANRQPELDDEIPF